MPRYALELALSGSFYAGTAIQPEHTPTLHRHLMTCLDQLEPGSGHSLQCCSRLDSGVAAKQFTAHVDFNNQWDPAALVKALNGLLRWPDNLRHASLLRAAEVETNWDAWRSSTSKTYAYHILVSPIPPLQHERCLWFRRPLQRATLQACAQVFLGHHDLSALAALRKDPSDAFQPVREILQSTWQESVDSRGAWLTYVVEGTGFLYKQVRGMVGTMCQLGLEKDSESAVERLEGVINQGRGAERIGEIVGPDGLELQMVSYGSKSPNWQSPALSDRPHSPT